MGEALAKDSAADNVAQRDLSNAIRALSMDAVQQANSGHPGMPMGMADVASVLFTKFLKFDASAPDWPDRDRFVLSAGHGSMLLYSLLYLTGYPGMDISQIKNFRQLGSKTAGHPEYGHAPGIETTTGPLGQGLGNAVGMAMAERLLNARHGDDIVDHFTYAIAGDGCLMEGISHEAISLAGHLQLSKLIVLFDDNSISIDGPTDMAVSDDQLKRFEACGWETACVDGHDVDAVAAALKAAQGSDKPSFIACKTIIGYGARSSPARPSLAMAHPTRRARRQRMAHRSAMMKLPRRVKRLAGRMRRSMFPPKFWTRGVPPARAARLSVPPGKPARLARARRRLHGCQTRLMRTSRKQSRQRLRR
jgi:transketolase